MLRTHFNVWHFVITLFFSVPIVFSQDRPNIVVILLDDAGYNDLGFQGSNIAITPNIDELAGEGTIFTQGYVTNSVCSPSRAGLLSGQYPAKFGFDHNIVRYSVSPDHNENDVGIDPAIPTMGNYLQELGYATSLFGKWHVGEDNRHYPNRRGFDHFYGLVGGARSYINTETAFNRLLRRNDAIVEPSNDNFYLTDLLTDEALDYMTDQLDSGTPFLAFMSYTAPHSPFQAKPEDRALFDNVEGLSDKQKNYFGMIKNVDDNVKRIVDLLQDRGAYDNTLFVFLSDNGGPRKNNVTNNGSLRAGKSSHFEGGLRVPFFTTWKNSIPSGNTYDNQVISLDLTTTFIKAAGGDLSDDRYYELDGKDLVAAINDNSVAHDMLYWRKKYAWSVISDGTNKVVFKDRRNEEGEYVVDTTYYNLETDISERTNLYPTDRSSVQNLVESYDTWDGTMDLPSWIGVGFKGPPCGDIPEVKNCPYVVDEYSAFATATQLTEVTRQPLDVGLGKETVLAQSVLEYKDSIKSPAVITYRLNTLPQHGHLMNSGVVMQVGDRFRQLDINKGKITYQHAGETTSSDSFSFRVNDGSGHENYNGLSLDINVWDGNGTTYYFSSSLGDDDNTGLSPNNAFASIDKLNSLSLNPGDTVLFHRGDTFIGQVICDDSGVDEAPIVYDAYGSGDLPIISGSTGDDGIPDPRSTFEILNQSFLEFKNLHIQNERFDSMDGVGDERSYGIFYVARNPKAPFLEHLYFSNLYLDKVYTVSLANIPFNSIGVTGIRVAGTGSAELLRDIIVEDSYFTDIQRVGVGLGRASESIIRNNTFIDIGGSAAILSGDKRVLYEKNYMQFCGAKSDARMVGRGSGMWTFACDGVVAQHNISLHARGSGDSSGMHVDWGNKNILYQYNYSEDSAGGFCETLGDNNNVIWRYNISVNDGDTEGRGKNNLLWVNGYAGRWRGKVKSQGVHIYNNTIYAGRDYNNEITDSKVIFEVGNFNFYNNIIQLGQDSRLARGEGNFVNDIDNPNFGGNIFYGGSFRRALLNLDASRIEADPMFVFSGAQNEIGYRLLEGSPAIDSAVPFQEPAFAYAGEGVFKDITARATRDFYGNTVNLDTSTNIGAYNGEPASLDSSDSYEAEEAVLNGGRLVECDNSSGGATVNVEASGSSVVFNVSVPETKDYLIRVFYMRPTVHTVGVRINGGEKEDILFQLTDRWCYDGGTPGNYQIVRRLNSGENTIELSNSVIDKIEVISFDSPQVAYSGEWEAEEAELLGTAEIQECSNFSEEEAVKGIKKGNQGRNAVVFDQVNVTSSGQYDLTLSYISVNDTTISIEVNGVVQTINVPATGSWCYKGGNPGNHTITIGLNSGMNVISVYGVPILDKIKVESSDATKQVSPIIRNAQLAIYPNPITKGDVINVVHFNTEGEMSDFEHSVHSSVVDVSGKTILKYTHNQGDRVEISTSGLERGLYFLKLRMASTVYIQRVLIK